MKKPTYTYIDDVMYKNKLYELWQCKYEPLGYDFLFLLHRNSRDIYLNIWEFHWNVVRLRRVLIVPISLDYGDFVDLRDFSGYEYFHAKKTKKRKYNKACVDFKKFFHKFLKPITAGKIVLPRTLN